MANLARNLITASPTTLVIRQFFQTQTLEGFVRFVKDGTEYADIFAIPLTADVTTLTTGITAGHYLTFDFTPGTTTNDQPSCGNVVLH